MLLAIGTVLVVFMGALGIYIGSIIAQTDAPGQTTRFSGGPDDVMMIIGVFGLVISFGVAAMAGGVWQIIYGKPNRILMVAMFLVAGILYVIARIVKTMS